MRDTGRPEHEWVKFRRSVFDRDFDRPEEDFEGRVLSGREDRVLPLFLEGIY